MFDTKFNLDLIYGPNLKIKNKYGFEPGREISSYIEIFAKNIGCDDKMIQTINNKVLNYAKKLSMTNSIIEAAIAKEHRFMGTQLRDAVALIFDDEIELLSYTEAAILFGRSALDIAAYVFALFTLEPFRVNRIDSFNSFSKELLKTTTDSNKELREHLQKLEESEFGWYRILCGKERGRAERDKIVHQTTSRIEYHEISPSSDKEYCHYIIGDYALPFEEFLWSIVEGIFEFVKIAEQTITTNYLNHQ